MDSPTSEQVIAQFQERLHQAESRCAEQDREIQELRQQVTLLRGVADSLPCFLFQTKNKVDGSELEMTYIGQGIQRFGYSPEQVYGRPELMVEMIHPDDRERYHAMADACLKDPSLPFAIDMRLVSPDQQVSWARIRSNARQLSDDYLSYSGICIDITEEKEIEARLAESQQQVKLALTTPDMGIYFWNLETDDLVITGKNFPAFGRQVDSEVIKMSDFVNALHPEDLPRIMEVIEDLIANRTSYEVNYRVVWPDGSVHHLSDRGIVQRDANGKAKLFCGVCWDVTHLERARGELESKVVKASAEIDAMAARWQAMSDCSPDFMMTLDRQGVFTYINRTAPGVTREQVIGVPMVDLATPGDALAIKSHLQATLDNGEMRQWETTFSYDGGVLDLLVRCGPLIIDDEIQGAVITSTDVSELRRTQRRLAHDEQLLRELWQLQEKERQLTALEIHDGFVQYVVGAQFALDAVRYRLQDENHPAVEDQTKGLEMLRSAITEARRTISRLRPLVIDDDGLAEALRYLAAEEADRYGFDVAIASEGEFDDLDPLLTGAMFRIVQEGISNVRRHSGVKHTDIMVRRAGDQIEIEISDDGKGFDLSKVSHERFGVRGIIERARLFGGSANIDSVIGAGTQIFVKLPTLARQTELHALQQSMSHE
ncbi:PAS domain-containing sensor histidine kinase [Blastopirellula retiformator]|uniref:Signal transduction histidine-protein kinase/phosphatase DegS n=1 Tax=Blastopirellula retiformator TaxID=2527970 RepID=A0A5C5V2C9_9BACT|nr:PAS domain-containing protein [Blastopirellula retiformator]TWT32638.1 Signal transduction histidine-protein kinase/phosphatase DegS [Blastopirellula retiformator]